MATTLAQMVKSKYPGVYDDMDDFELDKRIRSKYPGVYDDLPSGPAEYSDEALSAVQKGAGNAVRNAAGAASTVLDVGAGVGAVGAGAKAVAPGLLRRAFSAVQTPVGAGIAGAGTALAAGASPGDAIMAGIATGAGVRQAPAAARVLGRMAGNEAAKKAAPTVARAAKAVAEKVAPKAEQAIARAGTAATKGASRGAAVSAQHNSLMQFAKGVAAKNPKVGEKIWILLDDAGKPLRTLTPDEAGAAARKGLQTTWVKNLWR